eukprot:Nitzschia sp. Nitz4//scaffold62_size106224//52646//63438//NITZ4_004359-RA/size106224-processed-gene-0.169-mRNA-1//-1//CDS//3329555865//6262//frame0
MAKQVIVSTLEEIIGEYVVNIDQENLKISALRGKIKLENVQLDGDLLGSLILGTMGLSGFGILSCWAKSVKITIPLQNLEKEPTKIEMQGCHLLCLPLLPSTAQKLYGAGTLLDPRCTLRTRAKRSKLARFEKNFMSGRIPGEGPLPKRIIRAAQVVERDQKKKMKRRGSKTQQQAQDDEEQSSLLSLVSDLGGAAESTSSLNDLSLDFTGRDDASANGTTNPLYQDLPQLPRDWRVKLREKILRNLEASLRDIHVRCEVSQGGLDFCHPDNLKQAWKKMDPNATSQSQDPPQKQPQHYDQRAFAFGATLDAFVVRTANENWELGSHEKKGHTADTDHLGPRPYDARHNKQFSLENLSMYWDDDPPFLLSETELVCSSDHKLTSDKMHTRIAAAMTSLYNNQEPGPKIRESLQLSGKKRSDSSPPLDGLPHVYCFKDFSYQIRQKTSDRTEPGPVSCQAEFLPFSWNLTFRPYQFVQYQKLKSAMLSQQRFDTMVRQRPSESPLKRPKEWWKYAFGCVTSRPNARPWNDVLRISRHRNRYIELVLKKMAHSSEYSGFHGGLTELESIELLRIEDMLPLEALLSFHLVALRLHTDSMESGDQGRDSKGKGSDSPRRVRALTRPITKIFGGHRSRTSSPKPPPPGTSFTPIKRPPKAPSIHSASGTDSSNSGGISLLEAMTMRLGKKMWMTNFKIYQANITVTLLSATEQEIARLVCNAGGNMKRMGPGKLDLFFDVTRFEIDDCQVQRGASPTKILVVQSGTDPEGDHGDEAFHDLSLSASFPTTESEATTNFMDLPPLGVVCRLAASRDGGTSTQISFSAHPATLMWTRPCFDAVAEFFGAPSSELQTELTRHLRNAATPVARRAQLAFLSQSNFMFHINVAAPKIWIPFSSSDMDSTGALFLDAGNFRMSCQKAESHPNVSWRVDASDIRANFAKWRLSDVKQRIASPIPFLVTGPYSSVHGVSSVIRPFHVNASSFTVDNFEDTLLDASIQPKGPTNVVEVSVSPVCLNLVDVEVLARAIGKWYSLGLVSMRGRPSARPAAAPESSESALADPILQKETSDVHTYLSLSVDKIEMAIEGHSKVNFSDERSIESQEGASFSGFAPGTRTYVVEVFNIHVQRSRYREVSATKLIVADISIVQLKDPTEYIPMKARHEADETQYSILQRGRHSDSSDVTPRNLRTAQSSFDSIVGSEVFRVSFFHDGVVHLDEVEIDIDSVVLRVTPTTLKDCVKGIRKILELGQLMTREMERKVHEEGRKARRRDRHEAIHAELSNHRSISPAWSSHSDVSEVQQSPENKGSERPPLDSSLLLKVTIRDGTVLAGRPTIAKGAKPKGRFQRYRQNVSFAVVQVLSNALIMFQSIENPDSSGSKTLHISLDNLSASVDTEFVRIPTSQLSPMIGPTGGEFRVVNATENLGTVVSHDISLDCEHMKSSLTPNDLSILVSIVDTMLQRLKGVHDLRTGQEKDKYGTNGSRLSLISYQKRGAGIATNIRMEFHTFSFVVLRDFKTKYGAPEFLAFNLTDLKARLGGCASALSGDLTGTVSVNFFNAEVSDWEYAVEPCPVIVTIDQMPNELIFDVSVASSIQLNLTGIFLRDFAELDFGMLKGSRESEKPDALTPSALSTVGLRRATESHCVIVHNQTGMDIDIRMDDSSPSMVPETSVFFDNIGPGIIRNSCCATLDTNVDDFDMRERINGFTGKTPKLCLRLPPSASTEVGEREAVSDLPVATSFVKSTSIHILRPVAPNQEGRDSAHDSGRASPETVMTEITRAADYAYYNAEPVVEWCMQNQRLRSSTVDVYSLDKGQDLLSSSLWSPEEDYHSDNITLQGVEGYNDVDAFDPHGLSSPTRKTTKTNTRKSNWLRPYLKNDSPEWTDMTCILRMARERVMLPDTSWMWVNDWKVDVSGAFEEATDADGWEYQADFETFTRTRRFYNRGDSCRRRRWTRTRIVRPPRLDDPRRLLKVVWETSRDEGGNFKIVVRSHVTLHNNTSSQLSFFVYSPSWDDEEFVGSSLPGGKVRVPVALASAVYLRIACPKSNHASRQLEDYDTTDRIMMLPTSYNSNVWVRTALRLEDVTGTNLHFLLYISSDKGMIDVHVNPVCRVLNLLPCQLECQMGEVLRPNEKRPVDPRPVVSGSPMRKITNVETISVASGKDGKCVALNPASKPHISLRVPGYRWSCWQRIVNRKADTLTWRPTDAETDFVIGPTKGDADNVEEFKFVVYLDRLAGSSGDPLVLILSTESGHCPTVRVYAQYWIVDKTGFGCRFCEGFTDLLGTAPEADSSRRSYLTSEDSRNPSITNDMTTQGHQWSIGMCGMSMYFSQRERVAMCIESGSGDSHSQDKSIRSKWTNAMDISNVMPKTVFSVDELSGARKFELAIMVTVCPGVFSRTRMITFFPRYQIVNLLKRELVVAQDGSLKAETLIPSQSSVPFHWERGSLPSKVRLGAPTIEERDSNDFEACWTNGCIQLDKVGITSMRLPSNGLLVSKPMVVQAEVRLATKEQSSAVVIVIWSANEKSDPLYLLRNRTPYTILCRQPLHDEPSNTKNDLVEPEEVSDEIDGNNVKTNTFQCGAEIAPIVMSFLGLDRIEEFVWVIRSGDTACFGFDDPEKPHILEWTYVRSDSDEFASGCSRAIVEIDAMGSWSTLPVAGEKEVVCQIGAEHSTKMVEFVETSSRRSLARGGDHLDRRTIRYHVLTNEGKGIPDTPDDEEEVAFSIRLEVPTVCVSVVDNVEPLRHGREILLAQFDGLYAAFSQSREGYHEMELRLKSIQVDNHVPSSIHPVLLFFPKVDANEPFLHLSAVRRMQQHSTTYSFRYVAFRMLDMNIFLDRRTAETIARFIAPVRANDDDASEDVPEFVTDLTVNMAMKYSRPDRRAPRDIEMMVQSANSGRVYLEQLHLHPVKIALTFTQEWTELGQGTESMMVFQFIRGMASIADAPLKFTSFVVSHVFEAPQTLFRVIVTHYSSQLTKQIFAMLGSLAILGAPADFISNVGTGVRDFFYEPIQGAVHGPRQFIEGLEAGTQSLARGVFVGVVRGAANVTEVVNANLAGLTADDDFIDERKAHQRMLTDAMSRGVTSRTLNDSLYLAGASIARGVRSGALGIVDQPTRYASKYGPVGFVKGVGKAVVGAIVKPVVGVGDAAALLMNHVSDATSNKQVQPKIPKRLRRALPSRSSTKPNCVILTPYDDRAAKAQKIVTGGESVDDTYIGHVNIPSHLIISSDQCFWAIDRRTREPWCVSWEEISHFGVIQGGMRIVVFSQSGLKPFVFQVEDEKDRAEIHKLLSMQLSRMGNAKRNLTAIKSPALNTDFDMSLSNIPGLKSRQEKHVFGSCNETRKRLGTAVKDEIDLIEQCFVRVKKMSSASSTFFEILDEEAWTLVSNWGQVFSGLSSRRCIAAGLINGTGNDIQIKSTKLVEGGSPCYSIPTSEFDAEQGVLHAGGAMIFFGWGVVPNLLQAGNVFMHIETNAFIADLADQKSRDTYAEALSGYEIDFLEKSYDDSGWWAKYWLLLR